MKRVFFRSAMMKWIWKNRSKLRNTRLKPTIIDIIIDKSTNYFKVISTEKSIANHLQSFCGCFLWKLKNMKPDFVEVLFSFKTQDYNSKLYFILFHKSIFVFLNLSLGFTTLLNWFLCAHLNPLVFLALKVEGHMWHITARSVNVNKRRKV
jgi:hypothetical protein